jgi:prepilin signal peptidase PulO-like enzyme (type II secretory pathway)
MPPLFYFSPIVCYVSRAEVKVQSLEGPPLFFLTFIFGLFGSLLGSFSNVVVLRMASKTSVVFPPSSCPHCHHRLSPLDLIPIFGWLLLRGRCRYCSAPIAGQYPLVESAIALIVGGAFFWHRFSPTLIPTAGWGTIWLIAALLRLRGEVRTPAPFLWLLVVRIGLGALQGGLWHEPILFAAGSGTMVALFATFGPRFRHEFIPWASLGTALLLSVPSHWSYGALLGLAVCGITRAVLSRQAPDRLFVAEAGFFLLTLAGLATGLPTSFWGR